MCRYRWYAYVDFCPLENIGIDLLAINRQQFNCWFELTVIKKLAAYNIIVVWPDIFAKPTMDVNRFVCFEKC